MYWVDSSKRRNDVKNLRLLSNVRFPTSFQGLKESTHRRSATVRKEQKFSLWDKSNIFVTLSMKRVLLCNTAGCAGRLIKKQKLFVSSTMLYTYFF